jgi:hypothetical protein
MRRFVALAFCGFSLLTVRIASADTVTKPQPKAIAVEPALASPGQQITLRWYFTGTKVQVSGGRFGKGVVVTGKTSLTDTPQKTTHYYFDVWYHKPADSPNANPKDQPILHAQYSAVAEVQNITTYRDTNGWQISYLKSWQKDSFSPGSGGHVFYFQPEEDAVERLAVSITPASEGMTNADLLNNIRNDIPDHYTETEFLEQSETVQSNALAQWLMFRGIDTAHPETRSQTLFLAFVRDGKAFVISARTVAGRFKERQSVLEGMVRSFALMEKPASGTRTTGTIH